MQRRDPELVGTGRPAGPGQRQMTLRLDDEMFEELRQRAMREKTSLAEVIKTLVTWGLESEADASR